MYNSNVPTNDELPSTAKLIKSTILAAIAAGALLVTVVMPSEYGIDPTGVGNALGLKRMGEIKVSLAAEAEADKAKDAAQSVAVAEAQAAPVVQEIKPEPQPEPVQAATQNHEMTVTLAPDEGTEIKVDMVKGATVSYEWWTDGGKANFDVHGDSKELKISYHNYSKGSATRKSGELVADFDGSHGWFWRNRTKAPLTVTIKTDGEYSSIGRF